MEVEQVLSSYLSAILNAACHSQQYIDKIFTLQLQNASLQNTVVSINPLDWFFLTPNAFVTYLICFHIELFFFTQNEMFSFYSYL